jgi:hypothetical protein
MPGRVRVPVRRSQALTLERTRLLGRAILISVLHWGHWIFLEVRRFLGFSRSATQSRRHASWAVRLQVQGDRHRAGFVGSSSVESHMQIQHFLIPRVEEREGAGGRGCVVPLGFSSWVEEVGLSRRTVWESSEIMEGAADSS